MLRKTLILTAMFLVGCSTDLHTPPHVVCRDLDRCPSNAALVEMLQTFRDVTAATFDPQEDLTTYWYPEDMVFLDTDTGRVIGHTESPFVIHVTSVPVLVHEVMHVHLWRMFPDSRGDADHEAGAGPWTEATNDAVREVVNALKN